jgi:chemotaxis protein MotB
VNPESLVRSDVQTVIVRLKSADLFDPGTGEILPGGAELILSRIEENIREGVKQVLVDGHTDDVPIQSAKYPSNWELSAARASSVARVIIDRLQFPPERIVVTGYGQYRPLKPNNSDENRSHNRRVEIKILKDIKVAEQEKREAQKSQSPTPQNLLAIKQTSSP